MNPYFELTYHSDGKKEYTDIISTSGEGFVTTLMNREKFSVTATENKIILSIKQLKTETGLLMPVEKSIRFDKCDLEEIAILLLRMKLECDKHEKLINKNIKQ